MEEAKLSALLVSFGLVGLWAAAQFRAAACLGATAAAARLASSSLFDGCLSQSGLCFGFRAFVVAVCATRRR